ncbi:MAG: transcriptional regulator [Firmicutes bacterium]|nr:transcriptional regulator [Bacillota bacterium]
MNGSSHQSETDLLEKLEQWIQGQEGERLEFKEARIRFSFEDLGRYCCALANEGGGMVILGVTDQRPRRIVGTQAFMQPERTRSELIQKLRLLIKVQEIFHPNGRVLVFQVPNRPLGTPLKWDGVYWSRQADSLVPMSEDKLRGIFAETGHDFSAEVCPGIGMKDLDGQAIENFRRRWIDKSRNSALAGIGAEQLLRDAELLLPNGFTYAALILFGTRAALSRFLAQAEVIFEYRPSEAAGPAAQRVEYRQGFFSFYEDLWTAINLRNDLQHYQEGFFVHDVPTFAERPVREAILNAISHRDYQLGGSVFVRQYPRRLVVESPGGLPVGITVENILDRQAPRNRRIAEAFARCGLVERSGQGVNLMFEESIKQGKPRPDFSGTDAYQVTLTLHGQVQDPRFIAFLEQVNREVQVSFDVQDLLLLDLIHHEEPISLHLQHRLRRLADLGVIETVGRGRGTRYLLARRFYVASGQRGLYTRRRGLDRDQNKALLLKHLQEAFPEGCAISELQQVVPALSRAHIKRLLDELRREDKVRVEGRKRGSRWCAMESRPRGERG